MGITGKHGRQRVCVVGLDGVPHSLLARLTGDGTMPAAADLISLGEFYRMRASIPEISAVSWTSFATGANPGRHGIFGFVDLKPDSYELRFPNFHDCRAATIWERLGGAGGSSVVINQPFTYPARSMRGFLVAGFVALDLERGVFPAELAPRLKQVGYSIDIDTIACRSDRERLWCELDETLEGRRRAVEMLWKEDWDYFQVVVTGTDRMHHFAWDHLVDPAAEFHQAAIAYYRNVDRLVGEMWNRFRDLEGSDEAIERFYVLSDHGFCGIEQEVYLNRWLQQEGYLEFDGPQESLEEISKGSRAFCLDPGRIFINCKGRFPRGLVSDDRAPALAQEIAGKLKRLEFEGKPVICEVFSRQEIYSGPFVSQAADLIAVGNEGFDLKGRLGSDEVFARTDLTGMHTWDNAFVITGALLETPLTIHDLAAKIENRLGIERK